MLKKDQLEQDFQQKYFKQRNLKNVLGIQISFSEKIKIYFECLITSFKLKRIKTGLKKLPSRIDLESKIRELENEYYRSCQDYIRNVYLAKMLGNGNKTGLVNTFLNQVTKPQSGKKIEVSSFVNALQAPYHYLQQI